MHSADKILHAVTLLSEALQERDARELLLHHRQELQLAFDNLWGILRSSTSCNLPAVEPSDQNQNEDLPHHLPYQDQRVPLEAADVSHLAHQLQQPVLSLSPQSEPSLPELGDDDNPTQEQKDTVALFMKKLDRVSKNIRKFLNQSEDDALLINNDWTTDDPRLVDIDLAERRLTPSVKLRGWLARYSFADDYLAWAAGHYNLPREHFLILQPKDADAANRHSSPVTNYMSVINSEDQRIIRAIRHGLKYHSFHHIHGNFGAFAFLSQMFTAFRDVPYPCIKFLSDSIHGSSEWSGLSNKKATWISDCWATYSTTVRYSRQVRSRKRPFGAENPNEQGQSKRQQSTSSSENTTETRSHSTHAELNSCQFQDDESLPRPNLPQDLRELQDILGNFDPITDLDSLGVDYTDGQENPENTENLDRNDTTQSVPGFPQEDGHNHPTTRGRDGESLPSLNLPQDLTELQDLLGNFDPITDLDSLGVDYTDGQEHPENTENLDRNDTTQSVPGFPQEDGHNHPTTRGRDGESLPSLNLPQDLTELQDILGNFDPITDLDSLGVDYTDGQEHPENTENLDRNDTTQSVPVFPQKAGQDYHEVFPFQALESLAQPIC